ncbi:MAG: DsbA family protein [Candidatus Berkiella sp.]
MKKLPLILFSALFFLTQSVQAASFNDAQKEEIGTLVHDYILEHPEIITQAVAALQEKEAQAWAQKAKDNIKTNLTEFFDSNSPASDTKSPQVTVVEFFDYNCQHCRSMQKTLSDITSKDKAIKVVYKELPVLSEASVFAAKAALAAREQNKYVEFHDKLMSQTDMLSQEKVLALAKEIGLDLDKLNKDIASDKISEELMNNRKIAMMIGIRGTPTFVIGRAPATKEMPIEFIPGEMKSQDFIDKINSVKK